MDSPAQSSATDVRKKTWAACSACRKAKRRCDENRPCARCVSLSISDQCCDIETAARRRKKSHASSSEQETTTAAAPNSSASALYEALALVFRQQVSEYEVPSQERWLFNLELCCELLEKEVEGHHLSPQLRSHVWYALNILIDLTLYCRRQLIRFAKAIKPDVATQLQIALDACNLPTPVVCEATDRSLVPCHCMDIPVAIIGYRYNGAVVGVCE